MSPQEPRRREGLIQHPGSCVPRRMTNAFPACRINSSCIDTSQLINAVAGGCSALPDHNADAAARPRRFKLVIAPANTARGLLLLPAYLSCDPVQPIGWSGACNLALAYPTAAGVVGVGRAGSGSGGTAARDNQSADHGVGTVCFQKGALSLGSATRVSSGAVAASGRGSTCGSGASAVRPSKSVGYCRPSASG